MGSNRALGLVTLRERLGRCWDWKARGPRARRFCSSTPSGSILAAGWLFLAPFVHTLPIALPFTSVTAIGPRAISNATARLGRSASKLGPLPMGRRWRQRAELLPE
jgi:hypothetical protein